MKMILHRKQTRRLTSNDLSVPWQINNHFKKYPFKLYVHTTLHKTVIFKSSILEASLVYFHLKTVNKSFLFLLVAFPATHFQVHLEQTPLFSFPLPTVFPFISSYFHLLLFLPSLSSLFISLPHYSNPLILLVLLVLS